MVLQVSHFCVKVLCRQNRSQMIRCSTYMNQGRFTLADPALFLERVNTLGSTQIKYAPIKPRYFVLLVTNQGRPYDNRR